MFWNRKAKEVDPHDIGITDEMMAKWDDPNRKTVTFTAEQIDFFSSMSQKQWRAFVTFSPEQMCAINKSVDRNAKRNVQ